MTGETLWSFILNNSVVGHNLFVFIIFSRWRFKSTVTSDKYLLLQNPWGRTDVALWLVFSAHLGSTSPYVTLRNVRRWFDIGTSSLYNGLKSSYYLTLQCQMLFTSTYFESDAAVMPYLLSLHYFIYTPWITTCSGKWRLAIHISYCWRYFANGSEFIQRNYNISISNSKFNWWSLSFLSNHINCQPPFSRTAIIRIFTLH